MLALGAEAQLQYEWKRERWRIMGEQSYKSNRGQRTSDESIGHLRHNHRFRPWVSSLAFVQIQRNPFQRLQQRVLFGAGRVRCAAPQALAGLAGLRPYGGGRRGSRSAGDDTDQRLSSFVTVDGKVSETLTVQFTSFVQPRWSDFGDLRALALAGTRVKLGGGFTYTVASELRYDAEPPDDVDTTDWEVETGFGYRF